MSEFVCMDWDLQAIVRGCKSEASTYAMDNPLSCFAPLSHQQDVFFKFPDISERTTILDELEELYKPFYPQTMLTNTISVPTEVKKPKKQRKQQQHISGSANGTENNQTAPPKRGRKNQQKRVVEQVTADGLPSDMWAWRKYGQKPIKGSPYPRSYYRCSSSKGCLARKQVERSSSDPGIFIITYSGEHHHTHPTRRSSLAGITRSKALILRGVDANESVLKEPTEQAPLSPITPLTTSIENYEFVHRESIIKKEEEMLEEGEEALPDFGDELFSSFQDLEGLLFDQFPDNISDESWFFNQSAALSGS